MIVGGQGFLGDVARQGTIVLCVVGKIKCKDSKVGDSHTPGKWGGIPRKRTHI